MAEEKIIFKVVVDDDGNIIKLKSTQKGFQDIDLTVKNAEKSAKKLNETIGKTGSGATLKSINVTRKEYEKLANTQSQVKDATGSATSATMELSRVISDAPYGIRGMANNITQLVSQLGTASTKAGGLTAALKLMWSQLMGPLGVVFAITAVVSALDFFAGAQKKAKEETKEHNDELEKQYDKLSELNSLQKTLSVSGDAISLDWMDSFISGLDEIKTKDLLKILERDIKGITHAFNKLPEESRNIQGIGTLIEKRKELLKSINSEKSLNEELVELERKFSPYQFIKDSEKGKQLKEDIVDKQKELLSTQKLIIDLENLFKKPDDPKDRPTAFTLITPDSIKKQVKLGKSLIKAVAKVMGVELGKNPIDLNKLINVELSDETKDAIAEYNRQLAAETARQDKLTDAENFIKKSQEVLGGMTDFMNAQFERELTIEQNKTNALNVELNNRLNNENLSKDERAKIQNQIAINDENLRVKQEKINKKKFEMNKASNIANAIMDTSAAAVGVLRDTKGGSIARIAGMVAVIGAGLAQVATISRQKFQTSSAKTPINVGGGGASGEASERSEPSFNIVGRSGENLLINAIQAQFGKPLKAYVVSRDVTTQQQLDGMIVGQAGT
jgi:hypothetical protein